MIRESHNLFNNAVVLNDSFSCTIIYIIIIRRFLHFKLEKGYTFASLWRMENTYNLADLTSHFLLIMTINCCTYLQPYQKRYWNKPFHYKSNVYKLNIPRCTLKDKSIVVCMTLMSHKVKDLYCMQYGNE